MAPETFTRPKNISQEDYDVCANRIIAALAQRVSLIKSWTTSCPQSHLLRKTQVELDADDADLFRSQPPHLGIGAPIPSDYLVGEAERATKSLRTKFLGPKSLKASKARDTKEKTARAKRGLTNDSSDEEQGRSSLGRKKIKPNEKSGKTVPVNIALGPFPEEDDQLSMGFFRKQTNSSEIQKFEAFQHSDNDAQDNTTKGDGRKSCLINDEQHSVVSKNENKKSPARINSPDQNELNSNSRNLDANDKIKPLGIELSTITQNSEALISDLKPLSITDSAENKKIRRREKKKRRKLKAVTNLVKNS